MSESWQAKTEAGGLRYNFNCTLESLRQQPNSGKDCCSTPEKAIQKRLYRKDLCRKGNAA
jgi:hypothetical protein